MEFVGGQAVIEGVMMKSPTKLAVAVRNPDGEIVVKSQDHVSIVKRKKYLDVPFLRGPIILGETMILGLKALNYSTDVSLGEEEEDEKTMGPISMALTILFSLAFALVLFKLLPLGVAELALQNYAAFGNRYLFNLLEGVTKICILIGYIYLISLLPDVKRVFAYHGAEHKVVNAHENNDLENAEKYSTIHVRCGTSFVLFVLSLSIIVYLFLPIDIGFFAKYGLRLLLLPLIAGIGYELIRMSPKYEKYFWFKTAISPGLLLQKLTTREPNARQLEVAKAALAAVV